MACSVYGSQYLLDALYEVGEAEYALSLLTATHDRSWAHMIYDVNSTITTEAWDNKYKENQDWNHAWGAAPANIIPRDLMGLQPLEPGFKKIRIRPQIGSLTFARIKIPTIRGAVLLDIDHTNRYWQAKVTLPANMTAEIHLPANDIRQVRESGRPIFENPYVRYDRTESGKMVFLLPSGSYSFRIE
jgi:alpha-L-rhamnosidase